MIFQKLSYLDNPAFQILNQSFSLPHYTWGGLKKLSRWEPTLVLISIAMQEVLDNLPLPFVKFDAEGNVQYSNPLANTLSPRLAKTRLSEWLPEGQWESLKDDLLAPAPFSLTIGLTSFQALLSKVTTATEAYYLMTLTHLDQENVSVKSSR